MRAKRKDNRRFWAISVAFHALLIVLFFMTPVGQRIIKRDRPVKPEIIRKDEELARVIDQIRKLAVGRLKDQVTVLDTVSVEMQTRLETSAQQYSGFMSGQLAGVSDRLKQYGERTLTLQDELLLAVRAFAKNPEPDAEAFNAMYEPARRDIETGLEEFRRALMLLAPKNEALLQELTQAAESQYTAFGTITQAVHNRTEEVARSSRLEKENAKQAEFEQQNENNRKQLEQMRTAYDAAVKDKEEAEAGRKALESTIKELKDKIAAARKEKADTQALQTQLNQAGQELENTKKALREFEAIRQKNRYPIEQMERKINQVKGQMQRQGETIAKLEETIPRDIADRKTAIATAIGQQEEAVSQQKQVYAKIIALLDAPGTNGKEVQP